MVAQLSPGCSIACLSLARDHTKHLPPQSPYLIQESWRDHAIVVALSPVSQSKSRLRIILAARRDPAVKGDAPVELLVDGCCAYPTSYC